MAAPVNPSKLGCGQEGQVWDLQAKLMSPLSFSFLNLLLTAMPYIHALRQRSCALNSWQEDTKGKVCGLDIEFSCLHHVASSH